MTSACPCRQTLYLAAAFVPSPYRGLDISLGQHGGPTKAGRCAGVDDAVGEVHVLCNIVDNVRGNSCSVLQWVFVVRMPTQATTCTPRGTLLGAPTKRSTQQQLVHLP